MATTFRAKVQGFTHVPGCTKHL